MSGKLSFTEVYEDLATDRISTHIVEKRGRTIQLLVEHHGARDYDSPGATGRREFTNYTLALFVVAGRDHKGDPCLEVSVHNDADNTGVYGEVKPMTTIVRLTPDERMFR